MTSYKLLYLSTVGNCIENAELWKKYILQSAKKKTTVSVQSSFEMFSCYWAIRPRLKKINK